MGVIGDMSQYARYQAANAIADAAKNPTGIAGVGAGLAAGVAVGNQMAGALGQQTVSPPPLPVGATANYFVAIGGKQAGPFDMTALAAKAREGALARNTLVWKNGMSTWVAAESVPELQAFFLEAPPPLPPQA